MRGRVTFLAIALAIGAATMVTSCIGTGEISSVEQRGEGTFPRLVGIDLQGKERMIPDSLAAEWQLVTVAFEREQQSQVNTWIDALPEVQKAMPELHYYELPVIYEMNAAGRFWVNNGMRSGIEDEAARERTITIYTDRDAFNKLLNMQTDSIYTLLLDEKDEIVWRVEGEATPEKVQALISYLEMIGQNSEGYKRDADV